MKVKASIDAFNCGTSMAPGIELEVYDLLFPSPASRAPTIAWARRQPGNVYHPDVPPFLIQHGTRDDTVHHQQSIHFAAKIREIAGDERVILELIEGATRTDPKFDAARNVKKALGFPDQYLKYVNSGDSFFGDIFCLLKYQTVKCLKCGRYSLFWANISLTMVLISASDNTAAVSGS
jgi:hypothetical protein